MWRLRRESDVEILRLSQAGGADNRPFQTVRICIEEDRLTGLRNFDIDRWTIGLNGIVVARQILRHHQDNRCVFFNGVLQAELGPQPVFDIKRKDAEISLRMETRCHFRAQCKIIGGLEQQAR